MLGYFEIVIDVKCLRVDTTGEVFTMLPFSLFRFAVTSLHLTSYVKCPKESGQTPGGIYPDKAR